MGAVAKSRTLEQVERMKAKAARFVENVLGDPDRAEEIEAESPEEYAERKRIRPISAPSRHATASSSPASYTVSNSARNRCLFPAG